MQTTRGFYILRLWEKSPEPFLFYTYFKWGRKDLISRIRIQAEKAGFGPFGEQAMRESTFLINKLIERF